MATGVDYKTQPDSNRFNEQKSIVDIQGITNSKFSGMENEINQMVEGELADDSKMKKMATMMEGGKDFDDYFDEDPQLSDIIQKIDALRNETINASDQSTQEEFKSLEFTLTSLGLTTMLQKIINCSCNYDKGLIATSFLKTYVKEFNDNESSDDTFFTLELQKALGNIQAYTNISSMVNTANGSYNIGNLIDDLKTKSIQKVDIDANGHISKINFNLPQVPSVVNPNSAYCSPATTSQPLLSSQSATVENPSAGNINCAVNSASPSVEQVSSKVIENQKVGYRPENIWCLDDDLEARDDIKDTKSQAKKILRLISKGKDEDLNFVAEGDQIGDRKVNLATKEDTSYLKDHFAKPLRKLSVKDHGPLAVSENGLEPKKIWQALVSSYNKDGSVISDEKYWKDTFDSTDFAIKNTKRFANEMAKLGEMYTQYRKPESFGNAYTQQVISMMDNYLRTAIDSTDFDQGRQGVNDIYTKNNDASKNITGVTILDGKRDEEKAKSLLDNAVWTESQGLTSNHRQSAVETYNVKELVDKGQFAKNYSTTNEEGFINFLGDTSFSGGLDHSDMGLRGGEQIVAQFRIAVEQYAYVNDINMLKDNNPDYSKNVKIAQSGVLRNILTFAAHKSTRDGNAIISKILTDNVLAQNDLGKMMIGDKEKGGSSIGSILSEHPGIIKYLQNVLIENPDETDAIMLYGDQKKGALTKFNDTKVEALNAIQDPELKQVVETIMLNPGNAKAIQSYMDHYDNVNGLTQQQLLAMVAQSIADNMINSYPGGIYNPTRISTGINPLNKTVGKVNMSLGAGVGMSVSLAEHVRLDFGFGTDGSAIMPALGLSFDQNLGKGRVLGEHINLLMPGVGLALAKQWESKKSIKAIATSLDTHAIKNNTVGVDAYAGLGGFGGGIGFFREKDYLGGIDKGYEERKQSAPAIITSLLEQSPSTLDAVKDAIRNKYGKNSDPETINLMAENLFNAMTYYDCVGKPINQTMVANLSQTFAAEWKENAVKELKDRKLTGIGFRLGAGTGRDMAKTILTLGLSFKISNFSRGFHYEDSAEQLIAVKNANELGVGNRSLDMKNDTIGVREVDFMNRIFATTHHRMTHTVDDMQLTHGVDSITLTPDNKFVSIPQGLRDAHAHVNLKLDPSLKGQIKIENGNLLVPANAPMRVSAHAGTSGVEYSLSLGSHIDRPDAVHLIKGRQLPTDRQAESLDKINYISPIEGLNKNPLTAESINSQIAALKVADNGAYKDFTLNVVSANSRQVILNGLSADSIDPSSPLKLDTNGQIIIPAGSKLTVSKLNNKFILTTASTPNEFSLTFENKDYTSGGITADEIAKRLSEKFYINITNPTLKDNILTYIDTSGKEWSVNINSGKIGDVSFSMSDKDLVLRKQGGSGTNSSPETITYDEADTDIEDKAMYDLDKAVKDSDIRKLFEKLEDYQKSDFYKFMGYVMERKVPEAAKVLKTMLNNNKPLKDKVPGLYASLDQDLRTQQLVIARMLTVFALEPDKKGILLKEVFKSRVDTYEKVGSPSGQKLDFIPRSMIEEWYKDVKFTDAKDTKPYDNILGYTAFYRKNAKGDQKGYALTAPGYTRTVSDKIIKIAEKDTNMAKKSMDWLIANIKNDPFAQSVIVDTLQKKFDAAKIDITLDIDKVIALLEDKSNETLMTNDKKIIKLNAKPIFYLCAECANESLGFQIETITASDAVNGQPITIPGKIQEGAVNESQVIDFDAHQGNPLAINTTEASKSSLATTGEGSTHLGVTAGVGIQQGSKAPGPDDDGTNQDPPPPPEQDGTNQTG